MKQPYKIGGIIRDPDHTHLGFDFYLSLTSHELWAGEQQTWLAGNYDMVVVGIALATISGQAIRAAMANPVGSLRAE